MSDAVIIAMIVAIPPTLVALAGLIQSILNGRKAEQIHVLVDGNMSDVKRDLAIAMAEIQNLKALLAAEKTKTIGGS